MLIKFTSLLCFIGFTSYAFATAPYQGSKGFQESLSPSDSGRPFRLGIIKLSAELDNEKPLAPADYAGWTAHSSGIIIGAPGDKTVRNLFLETNKPVWDLQLESDLSAPPLIVGESVILGLRDGTLMKLDLRNGSLIWKNKLGSFASRTIVEDRDRVYVATALQTLYGVNIQDGKVEWLYNPELPNEIGIHNLAPPLLSTNVLYWGLSTGEILNLETQTGKVLWRHDPKSSGRGGKFHNYVGRMSIAGRRLIFCRYDGLIGAVSIETGQEGSLLWELNESTGNCVDSDFRAGRFYAATSTGDVHALTVSGQKLWTSKLGLALSSISAIEDSIFATGVDGGIYSLKQNGALIWYDLTGGRILNRPFFVKKRAYFLTGLKNLYVYRL